MGKTSYVATVDQKLSDYCAIFRSLFHDTPANVVLLNLQGEIVETNPAWNRFAVANGLPAPYEFIGRSYLEIAEPTAGSDVFSQKAYLGLLEVINARRPKFTMIYPCHSPAALPWYRMWVQPQMPAVPAIVVAHYLCDRVSIGKGQRSEKTWMNIRPAGSEPIRHMPAL